MKAWQLRQGFGEEKLELVEAETPRPGPGELLLAMRAASLNYRDLVVIDGLHGPAITTPLIPVSDGVGVVASAGQGVEPGLVGKRVCPLFWQDWQGGAPPADLYASSRGGPLDGALTTHLVARAHGVIPVPDYLSDEAAASLPCAGLTAWSALADQGGVGPGDWVLIQGTGGVALFALQFAKARGARVIMTSSEDAKLSLVQVMGADEVINYRSDPDWHKTVKRLTGGRGCDRVVELGGARTLEKSLRSVKVGGTVMLVGTVSGAKAEINLPLILSRNITVHAPSVGSAQAFADMLAAMEQHRIEPVIDRVFTFDEAPEAIRQLRAGGHMGKICVSVG